MVPSTLLLALAITWCCVLLTDGDGNVSVENKITNSNIFVIGKRRNFPDADQSNLRPKRFLLQNDTSVPKSNVTLDKNKTRNRGNVSSLLKFVIPPNLLINLTNNNARRSTVPTLTDSSPFPIHDEYNLSSEMYSSTPVVMLKTLREETAVDPSDSFVTKMAFQYSSTPLVKLPESNTKPSVTSSTYPSAMDEPIPDPEPEPGSERKTGTTATASIAKTAQSTFKPLLGYEKVGVHHGDPEVIDIVTVSNRDVSPTQRPLKGKKQNKTQNVTSTANTPVKDLPSMADFPVQSEPTVLPPTFAEPVPKINVSGDELMAFAEPVPDWDRAMKVWGVAWELHIYVVGTLFASVAFVAAVALIRLQLLRIASKGYFMALNATMLFLGVSRATHMFHDAYNAKGTLSPAAAYFLLNVGFPCLTSAFAILFLALLQATKVQLLSPRIQRPLILAGIIAFHFTFTLAIDVAVGELFAPQALTFVCQTVSVIWATILSIGYFYIFRQLYLAALRKQGELIRATFTKMHIDGARLPRKLPRPTLGIAVRLTLATAILSLLVAFLQLYGILGVYGILGPGRPEPWPWWGYQIALRTLELAMGMTMTFVATQPLRHYEPSSSEVACCSCSFPWPCRSNSENCCFSRRRRRHRCSSNDDLYPAYCASNTAVARTKFTFERWDRPPANTTNPATVASFYLSRSTDRLDGDAPLRGAVNQFAIEADEGEPAPAQSLLPVGAPMEKVSNQSGANTIVVPGNQRRYLPLSASTKALSATHVDVRLSHPQDFRATLMDFRSGGVSRMPEVRSCFQARPPSMLFNENGFIRFRDPSDPEQPMVMTDDESADRGDLSPNKLFQNRRADIIIPRFTKIDQACGTDQQSGDNSLDTTMDDIGVPVGGIPFRRNGSPCSSESATASFDVFYLNPPPPTPVQSKLRDLYKRRSEGYAETTASQSQQQRSSSLENQGLNFQLLCSRTTGKDIPDQNNALHLANGSNDKRKDIQTNTLVLHPDPRLNLNLPSSPVNFQGTVPGAPKSQDITPDSAVYLDLNLPNAEEEIEDAAAEPRSGMATVKGVILRNFPRPASGSSYSSFGQKDPTLSRSMTDLHQSTSSGGSGKTPKRPRSLFYRLRGSTFSLNGSSHHGYEPLDSTLDEAAAKGGQSRGLGVLLRGALTPNPEPRNPTPKMWRAASEDQARFFSFYSTTPNYTPTPTPTRNLTLTPGRRPKDFRQWEMRTVFRGSGASSRLSRDAHNDSLYGSSGSGASGGGFCFSPHFSSPSPLEGIFYVDTEVQTDPVEFYANRMGAPPVPSPTPVTNTEPAKREEESTV